MTDITRAKAKAISPDELREQGRRGLTGAEFILLMLGYDCDCVCHIAGQWAHCYDCDPPTLKEELR